MQYVCSIRIENSVSIIDLMLIGEFFKDKRA